MLSRRFVAILSLTTTVQRTLVSTIYCWSWIFHDNSRGSIDQQEKSTQYVVLAMRRHVGSQISCRWRKT